MSATYQTELDFYSMTDKPSQLELDNYYAQKYFQESKSKAYAASYSEQELRLLGKNWNSVMWQFVPAKTPSLITVF